MGVQSFFLPKAGNSAAEYEDACWPEVSALETPLRLAVADGATESSFASLWARLLVSAYGRGELADPVALDHNIAELRKTWSAAIPRASLPWYAQEKALSGAFAALVGLTLHDHGAWSALGVGDCVCFQLRGGELLVTFPLNSPDEFSSRPRLLGSEAASQGRCEPAVRHGHWLPGDRFLLMSDALAHCYWRLPQQREALEHVGSEGEFAALIAHLRQTRDEQGLALLKNDDVTLVRCQL